MPEGITTDFEIDQAEIIGGCLYSMINGLDHFQGVSLQLLEEEGISDVDPVAWYPLRTIFNLMEKIQAVFGDNTLCLQGIHVISTAQFPPGIETWSQAMAATDQAYMMNHRNGYIGRYEFEHLSKYTATMRCVTPYPEAFEKGILLGICMQYPVTGYQASITLEASESTESGEAGSCTFSIRFEKIHDALSNEINEASMVKMSFIETYRKKFSALDNLFSISTGEESFYAEYVSQFNRLTQRQQEVLDALAEGKDNQQISDTLQISILTVKKHISVVLNIMEAQHRTELTAKWHKAKTVHDKKEKALIIQAASESIDS